MKTQYVIESRACERAEWAPWPALVPFSNRADAEAQAELLNAREPMPTRSWMARREFRVAEAPVGCPKCIQNAVGAVCAWHVAMERIGAKVPAPRPLPAPKKTVMSPKVRRSPRAGYGPEAIATLRCARRSDRGEPAADVRASAGRRRMTPRENAPRSLSNSLTRCS